jgi:hypothetical protein
MYRARDALKQCLPESLKDQTFASTIGNEESVQRWLQLLLKNLTESTPATSQSGIAVTATTSSNATGVPPMLSKGTSLVSSSSATWTS